MGIDETRKEFDRVTELMAKGAGEMESRSLDQAQSTYFEALKLIDTLGLSLVRIECLERLADSYYASKKFLEASTVYGQLVAALDQEEAPDMHTLPRALLKLGRSKDRIQAYDEADISLARALESGEAELEKGDALLTEIYEAYADLLRRNRKNPDLLTSLEQKVRRNRQIQAGTGESDEPFIPESKRNRKEKKEEINYYQKPPGLLEKVLDTARRRPRLAIGVLFLPVIFAGLLMITMIGLSIAGIDTGLTRPVPTDVVFASIDRQMEFRSLPGGKAELIRAGTRVVLPLRSLDPWSELFASLRPAKGDYWLSRTSFGIQGEDGLRLFAEGNPEIDAHQAMSACAQALTRKIKDKRLRLKSDYDRELREKYGSMRFQMKPFHPASASPTALLRSLETADRKSWPILFAASFARAGQMTITALVPDGTDKYFFVVASDRSGRLLKVEGEERVDVLYYIEGSAPRLASTGSSVGGRLLSSRRILACEHSKEAVARKYQHFFFAVIFLIALVLGGQFLLRQINLKTPEVTYVTAQSVSHARGFAANFLVVYLLLWIAYLFYLAYLFII